MILLLVGGFLDIVVAVGQNIEEEILFHSREDTLQIPELRIKVRGWNNIVVEIFLEN